MLDILGATALVQPIEVPPAFAILDIRVMLAAMVLLVWFVSTGGRITRSEGGVAIVGYRVYVGYLVGVER